MWIEEHKKYVFKVSARRAFLLPLRPFSQIIRHPQQCVPSPGGLQPQEQPQQLRTFGVFRMRSIAHVTRGEEVVNW